MFYFSLTVIVTLIDVIDVGQLGSMKKKICFVVYFSLTVIVTLTSFMPCSAEADLFCVLL